jgi:hypothetical protein
MADRLFLFQDDDTDTEITPFRFTGQSTVERDAYDSSRINFYNTALGLSTLEEESGIDVDVDEDITELADPAERRQERKEKEDESPQDFLRRTLDVPLFGGAEGQVREGTEVNFYNTGVGKGNTSFDSYADYLKAAENSGLRDRIPFVQNILEPSVTGDFTNIKFGETLQAEAKTAGRTVKSFPEKVGSYVKGTMSPDEQRKLEAGLVSAVAGFPGTIGGDTVKNAFGNNSYRPPGALGLMADIVHAKQYADMAAIRSRYAAFASAPSFGGLNKDAVIKGTDMGFAMTIGNFGITRAPGSGTYTGNTRGMSHEQIKALEAISLGYDPTRGRYNMLNPSKSQTVADSGGMFISNNNMDGFFRANGTFYDPRMGSSGAYSTQKQAYTAAETAFPGIGREEAYNKFQDALARARTGEVTLAEAISQTKRADAAAIRAANQRKEQEAERAAEAERQRRREQFEREERDRLADLSRKQRERVAGEQETDAMFNRETGRDYAEEASRVDRFGEAGLYMADGGRVGLAMGGASRMASGFVDRPPEQVPEDQTVADNRPTQLPEGAFVINAAAVEFAGSSDIKDMLLKAHKEAMRRGLTVDKQGNGAKLIDVAISSGEVVVAPYLAKIIGYDRLNKINNRGMAETRERIRENGQDRGPATIQAAVGRRIMGRTLGLDPIDPEVTAPQEGFVAPQRQPAPPTPESYADEMPPRQGFVEREAEFPDIPDEVPQEFMDKLTNLYSEPITRTRLLNFYKTLSDVELLTYLTMSETKAATAEAQHMYAVAQTTVNRKDNTDPNLGFKNQDTLPKVILKRLPKGAFEYDGLDKTRGVGMRNEFNSNFNNFKMGVSRAYAISSDILSGEMESSPAIPKDVMWYENPTTTGTSWMQDNLQYFDTFGSHAFYTAPPK